MTDTDVIVIGAGLAGLVATVELGEAGRRVILLDQEPEVSLGGQAFWSFGGLFLVDSPEQRRLRIRDSPELALADWLDSAGFDRDDDTWPRRWAEAYVEFAAGEKRSWLHRLGVRFFPVVQWAERGGGSATGHGNSVPRFHVTWGTGPGLLEPFVQRAKDLVGAGLLAFKPRHRVTELITEGGAVSGVRGELLEASPVQRGEPSTRNVTGDFQLTAQSVIVTSGGIGANHDLVREHWPARLGKPPVHMLTGVPDHVDGAMLNIAAAAGGNLINLDRMWHYPEGLHNHTPIWSHHGIRILSGPTPLWLDATGTRLPAPLFPGFDTLGALQHIGRSGHDHSWFLLNQRTIGTEFALSGSEQNPDLTGRSVRRVLRRALPGAVSPVEAFQRHGRDFVVATNLLELAAGMNRLVDTDLVDAAALREQVAARDLQLATGLGKDAQLAAINAAWERVAQERGL